MASVKNKNTKPEITVRKILFSKGFRYKINDKSLPGTPDIVLPKYNTVIFIHGCFWHGHENCSLSIKSKTNTVFWENKIQKNKKRDKETELELKNLGWKVITVWACELKNASLVHDTLEDIILNLNDRAAAE